MGSYLKRILCGSVIAAILLCSASCGSEKAAQTVSTKKYDTSADVKELPSGTVYENSEYRLDWDQNKKCVLLVSKSSGTVWSTTPYQYYQQQKSDSAGPVPNALESPINIEYLSTKTQELDSVSAKIGAFKNGRVSSTAVDQGIELTFYFDKVKISVPVRFILAEDGIKISIVPSAIVEGDIYKVFKISVAPFLCSSQNDKSNYVFIPSGSGALMYADERGDSSARTFTENLYGTDPTQQIDQKLSNTESMKMAAFGVKSGNTAICGIIENGAEHAKISAEVGNGETGYSAVYAEFQLRGHNASVVNYSGKGNQYVNMYTDDLITDEAITVGYYPLSGSDADYGGMAKKYRNYLIKTYHMSDKAENPVLSLTILGGLKVKKHLFGIPYYSINALTTFREAQEMIRTIAEKTDVAMDVQLAGFGQTGLDVGKIAGGFSFNKAFGSSNDYKALQGYCKDSNIPVYTDYDIINFKQSGNGFSKTFHTAKTANGFVATRYVYSAALRDIEQDVSGYMLLSRSKLKSAVEKLKSTLQKQSTAGVSLSSLGQTAYSDYDDVQYYVRGGMSADTKSFVNDLKEQKIKVASSSANDYMTAVSDKVFDSPAYSTQFDFFDEDIPFYQMVFKGYVSLSAPSVNLAVDDQISYLKALESGSSIGFTLVSRYNPADASMQHSAIACSLLEDNIGRIAALADEAGSFLTSVKDAKISSHEILENGVRKTVFDNGVTVCVNYGNEECTVNGKTIKSMGFLVLQQ